MTLEQLQKTSYDLAFVVAMQDEAQAIYLQSVQSNTTDWEIAFRDALVIGEAKFLQIDLETQVRGYDVTLKCLLCVSKIGKVYASSATTIVINLFDVGMIINYGLCGGIDSDVHRGTVIIASTVSYGDVDVRAFGYKFGQVPHSLVAYSMPPKFTNKIYEELRQDFVYLLKGRIITLDRFISDSELKTRISELVAATMTSDKNEAILGFDMESTAIAQVCNSYKKTLFVFKEVSDSADEKAGKDFAEFTYADSASPCSSVVSLIMAVLPEFYLGLQVKLKKASGE